MLALVVPVAQLGRLPPSDEQVVWVDAGFVPARVSNELKRQQPAYQQLEHFAMCPYKVARQ